MPRTKVEDQKLSRPVEWFMLIEEVDTFNHSTGLGLASVWGHIHREEYDLAYDRFQEVKARWVEWTTLKV